MYRDDMLMTSKRALGSYCCGDGGLSNGSVPVRAWCPLQEPMKTFWSSCCLLTTEKKSKMGEGGRGSLCSWD